MEQFLELVFVVGIQIFGQLVLKGIVTQLHLVWTKFNQWPKTSAKKFGSQKNTVHNLGWYFEGGTHFYVSNSCCCKFNFIYLLSAFFIVIFLVGPCRHFLLLICIQRFFEDVTRFSLSKHFEPTTSLHQQQQQQHQLSMIPPTTTTKTNNNNKNNKITPPTTKTKIIFFWQNKNNHHPKSIGF